MHCRANRADHGGVDRVEFIGSIQAEQGDRSLLVKCDGFESQATTRQVQIGGL